MSQERFTLGELKERYSEIVFAKSKPELKELLDNMGDDSANEEVSGVVFEKPIQVIEQAGIFGDKVLSETGARYNSAFCLDEYTELLAISHKLYHDALFKAIRKELDKKISFLRETRIFARFSGAYLQRLLLFFDPVTFGYGQKVYRAGE